MDNSKNQKRIKSSDKIVLKWIVKVCKKQLSGMIALVFVNAVAATTSVLFANFSKRIIDAATQANPSKEKVIANSLLLLGVVLFQLILRLTSSALAESTKFKLDMRLREYLLSLIYKKEYGAVSSIHTGELQNRLFNDVSVVSDGFSTLLPDITNIVVRLICALTYLVILEPKFTLVFVAGGIGVFVFSQFFRRKIKELHKEVQRTEGKSRSFIQESIINLLVVKVFRVEKKMEDETHELNMDNFRIKMKRRLLGIGANAGISAVFSAGYVFALAFGGISLVNNTMTYGTVTAILQLVNQVQTPFSSLSGVMPKLFGIIASAERLMEIENLPDEKSELDYEIDADEVYKELKSIDFRNITFSYEKSRETVLNNADLSINKGDFVAITGISGIGKSTLLKLLLGVFTVQSGEIVLNTETGQIPCDKNTRKLFSYVPQGNMLISGTIRDNITFINEASSEEIENAVRISCADDFIKDLPMGLETVIGEKGLGLSEGQVQRLAIARSLLAKSPVILLDEATSALDEKTEKRFLENLHELDNITCIIISHKKATLDICNKCVRISEGKIITDSKKV